MPSVACLQGPAEPSGNDPEGTPTHPLVMIGLMASDVRMGVRAMRDYCQALGLPYTTPQSRVGANTGRRPEYALKSSKQEGSTQGRLSRVGAQ